MKNVNAGQVITILANVGVIASIIFLAYQVRLSTRVARQEAYGTFADSISNVNLAIFSNPQVAELVARSSGNARRDEFTETERAQLDLILIARLRVWEGLYQSYAEGISEDAYADLFKGWKSPYFQEFWEGARGSFDPGFVALLETHRPDQPATQ